MQKEYEVLALEENTKESLQKVKTKKDETLIIREEAEVIKSLSDKLPKDFSFIFEAIDALTKLHSIFFHQSEFQSCNSKEIIQKITKERDSLIDTKRKLKDILTQFSELHSMLILKIKGGSTVFHNARNAKKFNLDITNILTKEIDFTDIKKTFYGLKNQIQELKTIYDQLEKSEILIDFISAKNFNSESLSSSKEYQKLLEKKKEIKKLRAENEATLKLKEKNFKANQIEIEDIEKFIIGLKEKLKDKENDIAIEEKDHFNRLKDIEKKNWKILMSTKKRGKRALEKL